MLYLRILLLIVFSTATLLAQDPAPDTSGIQHGKIYEIKLREPVKCIQHMEYDKLGKEPDWKLSEDNQTIFIQDYIINTKVKVKVIYQSGKEEEFTQSPCTIKLSNTQPVL